MKKIAKTENELLWLEHLDLHLTEHDAKHAGLALRAGYPTVKRYIARLEKASTEHNRLVDDNKTLRDALADILAQVVRECERNGEGNFETAKARAAIAKSK